jgi:hypothetical protein
MFENGIDVRKCDTAYMFENKIPRGCLRIGHGVDVGE